MAEIGNDIEIARKILEEGGLVAIPTETVYGLAGNAYNADTVINIFKVKNRPSFDPLITHTCGIEKIREYVQNIPELAYRLAEAFWPGPLTLLLQKTDKIPDIVTSGLETIAVRVPDHALTCELLESIDFPLAAPSANPFGYVSPTTAGHVDEQLGSLIPYVLDGGPCRIGIESTIIGFKEDEQPIIHRLGGKIIEEIEEVVGEIEIKSIPTSNPVAPGMLDSHYSPEKKVIFGNVLQNLKEFNPGTVGVLAYMETFHEVPSAQQFVLSRNGDLEEAGKNLFSGLRYLDKMDLDAIIAEPVPNVGLGRAINDRLARASVNE